MHPQHHVDYSARRPAPAAAPVRHVSPVLTGFPRGVHEVATCDGYRCLQAIDSRGVLVEEYRGRADLFARRLPVVFARLWEALEQADPVSAARHLAIVGAG